MRKLFISSVAALALVAGAAVTSTPAKAECLHGCVTAGKIVSHWGPMVAGAGVVLGAAGLIYAHQAYKNGELRAAAPTENELLFAANAKGLVGTPAYAFISVPANVAAVK